MTAKQFAVAVACPGAAVPVSLSAAVVEMTFEEVFVAARETPQTARSAARVERAEAMLVTARTYPHNPELTIEAADRRGPADSTTDRGLSLSGTLPGMDWIDEPEVNR